MSAENGAFLKDEADWFQKIHDHAGTFYFKLYGEEDVYYANLFIQPIKSYEEPTQDNRRINIYLIPKYNSTITLSSLCQKTKIHAATSASILAQLLTIYMAPERIAEKECTAIIQYPTFSPDNFLINPEDLTVVCHSYTGIAPDIDPHEHIRILARFILNWTDFSYEAISHDGTDEETSYEIQKTITDLAIKGHRRLWEAREALRQAVDGFSANFIYRLRNGSTWIHKNNF